MGSGRRPIGEGEEGYKPGFSVPLELFDYSLAPNSRFGKGFENGGRSLYPFRIIDPVLAISRGREVRAGPLEVVNANGTLVVLMEKPEEIKKDGFWRHPFQGYGLKHLSYDFVQKIAEDHSPSGANLYTPLILELGQDFAEIQQRVTLQNSWRRPSGRKIKALERILKDVSLGRRKIGPFKLESIEATYRRELRREQKKIDENVWRKVRARWGDYVSSFHPILGIQYFSVSQKEVDRIKEIVDLIDNPDIQWPERTFPKV